MFHCKAVRVTFPEEKNSDKNFFFDNTLSYSPSEVYPYFPDVSTYSTRLSVSSAAVLRDKLMVRYYID